MSRWATFALILAVAAPASAEARFFSTIEDLPLAPGLNETGSAFVFGGIAGRIIEAAASGTATTQAVRQFYVESLAALGWSYSPSTDGPMQFLRGREELSLTVREQAGAVRLEVRLISRPASTRVD